ncbi:MAG: 3'-5' exonuclease [Lentisphaeraceae bacterium]|nr:3'-5' exonuclease [Lentisphaeraceae bacterium]
MRVATLDFETANAQRNSACALGVTLIDNQQITETNYWLIKPIGGFDYRNVMVHGLNEDDVYNKPNFAQVWPEIKAYLGDRLLLAHNAAFDMSVLRKTLEAYGLEKPVGKYSCTMRMAKNLWPHHRNHKLDTLCDHFGFELDHHNAASDALACARIGLELCSDQQVSSFADLLKVDKKFPKKL